MSFESDDQRKAVMAKLNKRKGVSSHEISLGKSVSTQFTASNKMLQEKKGEQIGMALSILFSKTSVKKLEVMGSEEAHNLNMVSRGELKDLLDYTLDQWDTAINTWNWERIIDEHKKKKEIDALKEQIHEQLMNYVDQSFGYDKPSKRPTTQAEKLTEKLSEGFQRQKDEELGYLGEQRKVDYLLVKEITNAYLTYLANETMEELPNEFI